MLMSLNHEVFLYSGFENEANCTEHIEIVHATDLKKWFPNEDFSSDKPPMFNHWDKNLSCWTVMNARAIAEIKERAQRDDIVGIIAGNCQDDLTHNGFICAEWGIGYEGVLGMQIPKAYESYAWRHYIHGLVRSHSFQPLDAVIPNSYELTHHHLGKGGDHFVYLGRMIKSKGVEDAAATCRAIGAKLILAGQGIESVSPGHIVSKDGMHITGDVEYIGVVNPVQRAELLANARALFVSTKYLGPFEGVSVEAMLAGTPVLTTDWGVFAETVIHGVTGYRCSNLDEMYVAARKADNLDRRKIREHALQFSTDVVRYQYEHWFEKILNYS
jgi:glycosyltransferase involved in cell wall biosynthesis